MLKRFLVALLTFSLLCPTVVIAAPYSHGDRAVDTVMFKNYDSKRHGFVMPMGRDGGVCEEVLVKVRSEGRILPLGHACIDFVPAVTLVMPQSYAAPVKSAKTWSAPARRETKRPPVSHTQLAHIANAAADAMDCPTTFAQFGVAFDRCGRPVGVFSSAAVKCDALGWILKKSCDELALTHRYYRKAYLVSELLNKEVLRLTGRSIVAINDEDGRRVVVAVLKKVAAQLMANG